MRGEYLSKRRSCISSADVLAGSNFRVEALAETQGFSAFWCQGVD
jgi:hypothetical protein